ncbi:hypothetical protein D3Z52_02480 [Clostridiaceae bacterium]|nr:hypothetical protein [Clostridiaceae bacterium]
MYRRKMIEQKLMGLGLLACCVLILWLCSTGTTPEDQDATALVLLLPLALYMLFAKEIVIY